MPHLLSLIHEDISNVMEHDPAAKSRTEVFFCYAGLHAVWWYRIDHWFWNHGMFFVGRFLSQVGRLLTAIEIHPGARIGSRLFIDHGMGVVIGETSIVGDGVTLYQGVTLGGTGKETGKRHPTIGNNVVIGSGANVLGNILIGENCRVGAGSVVLRSIPENSTVVGVPARIVYRNGKRVVITDPKEISDPLSDVIASLVCQLQEFRREIEVLKSDRAHEPRGIFLSLHR